MAAKSDAELESASLGTVGKPTLRLLAQSIQGTVLFPQDERYRPSCQLWTGGLPKRPGMVVRCANEQDVATALRFVQDHHLPLAIRGGGHTLNAVCDDGVLLNLGDMNTINVHPQQQTVEVQAGLVNGTIDKATSVHGLAAVLGECPSVGISGLSLGGGLGRLMGAHGALCDNLLAARIVTADGQQRTVNAQEHPDLYWAIRGGGGNFGVVTSLTFRIHPVNQVLAGMIRFPLSQAARTLKVLREIMAEAPNELDALVEIGSDILQYAPDAKQPLVVVNVCCGGDSQRAAAALRPLRAIRPVLHDDIRSMTYFEAQGLGDVSALLQHISGNYRGFRRSGFVAGLPDAAIERIVAACENPGLTAWSFALDHFLHGRVCEVPEDAMAFCLRRPGFNLRAAAFEAGQETPAKAQTWVKEVTTALLPYSDGRLYYNYITDQGKAGVRAALGKNFQRLAQLKHQYDPTNLFRRNGNIRPQV
jgi:FAD/FMN-containing dehydrogenase